MVPISQYYLGKTPPASQSTSALRRPTSMSSTALAHPSASSQQSPPTPKKDPVPKPSLPPTSPPLPPSEEPRARSEGPRSQTSIDEDEDEFEDGSPQATPTRERPDKNRKRRQGTMNKQFKFPPDPPSGSAKSPDSSSAADSVNIDQNSSVPQTRASTRDIPDVVEPVELPPPTPIKKDEGVAELDPDLDEEVGETEEIDLN